MKNYAKQKIISECERLLEISSRELTINEYLQMRSTRCSNFSQLRKREKILRNHILNKTKKTDEQIRFESYVIILVKNDRELSDKQKKYIINQLLNEEFMKQIAKSNGIKYKTLHNMHISNKKSPEQLLYKAKKIGKYLVNNVNEQKKVVNEHKNYVKKQQRLLKKLNSIQDTPKRISASYGGSRTGVSGCVGYRGLK